MDTQLDTATRASPKRTDEVRLIRLLDAEPDFATGVRADDAAAARRHTIAPAVTVAPGPWSPDLMRTADAVTGPFAAIVLNGLIARDVVLADRVATQLVGAGDVIPLGDWDDGSPPIHTEWRVAVEAEVAVLDARFLAASQRWPWLTARMVERAARWADRAAGLQAITQLGRVDLRLVALLWHLADRWGRVTADGVLLPLRLTHETLGRLVGAQRPTVTLALRDLREQGAIERRGTGWLLARQSRDLLEPQRERLAPAEDGLAILEEAPVVDLDERLAQARQEVASTRARGQVGHIRRRRDNAPAPVPPPDAA
ncbi:MAG TPA: Crp/Fnr family transcriptional regulator [Solirubrobacteraceae bacterium]|nr:Crp/Fnr family transcriptional regulator [Solirubrobacteraceae bacterium]